MPSVHCGDSNSVVVTFSVKVYIIVVRSSLFFRCFYRSFGFFFARTTASNIVEIGQLD